MKDVVGRDIEIGMVGAFVMPGYRGLTVGKVTAFTAKKVRLEFTHRPYGRDPEVKDTLRDPGDIAIIEGDAVTMYYLSRR